MTNQGRAMTRQRSPRPIRSQLLVAVNGSLAVVAVMFLGYDYRREFNERLEEKRIALEEEAKTMMPAVLSMSHRGPAAVQRYIDAVCGQMQDAQSPGHHIAVRLRDDRLQAVAHHRASPEILGAMQKAARTPKRRAAFKGTELVVGACERQGVQVLVSETLDSLRRASRNDVLGRLMELVVLACAAAVVLNVVFWRIATRPLERLVSTVRNIAAGELGARTGSFRSAELSYLAHEIDKMSSSLAEADRHRVLQMAKARDIQQHLQPAAVETPGVKVAHLFVPAEDVAGDYYDVLPLPDGTWLFCIADVTGHGVPAAMNAAMAKVLLIHATESLHSPSEFLQQVNRRYCEISLVGDFITMLLVRIYPEERKLEYASAGHETALLQTSSGAIRELQSTGFPLGLRPEAEWKQEALSVEQGERLLMVTDGVTEMFNAKRECFGRARLAGLFRSTSSECVDKAVEQMDSALATHRDGNPSHDDVTLVLVAFVSPESP